MVNPGGPGRGRRGRPRPAAASRAAGVDPGGLGWGRPDSLLANSYWRRRPSSTAGGSGGSVAPESRSCLDRADQGVRASPPARRRACSTDDQPAPSPSSGVALHVQRHRGSPIRRLGPGPTTWLARVAPRTRAAVLPCNRPAPAVVTAHPVRSPANQRPCTRVNGSFIRRSPAIRRRRSRPGERRNTERTEALACCGAHPQLAGEPPVTPRSTGSAASRTCEPDENTQRETVPQHPLRPRRSPSSHAATVGPTGHGRSPSRASSPTSHLRPTRSSARIRLTDHPGSTCRARR
jgi:hypothetical protein